MTPPYQTLEAIGPDLDEARAKIVATRAALQAVLDCQDDDVPELSRAIAGLERIEAELTRIDGVISGQAAAAVR